jgi:hypothetical protein
MTCVKPIEYRFVFSKNNIYIYIHIIHTSIKKRYDLRKVITSFFSHPISIFVNVIVKIRLVYIKRVLIVIWVQNENKDERQIILFN